MVTLAVGRAATEAVLDILVADLVATEMAVAILVADLVETAVVLDTLAEDQEVTEAAGRVVTEEADRPTTISPQAVELQAAELQEAAMVPLEVATVYISYYSISIQCKPFQLHISLYIITVGFSESCCVTC